MIDISKKLYPYWHTISQQNRTSYDLETGLMLPFAWCIKQFGHPSQERRWNFDTYLTFMFKNEQDCIWFALRWS